MATKQNEQDEMFAKTTHETDVQKCNHQKQKANYYSECHKNVL